MKQNRRMTMDMCMRCMDMCFAIAVSSRRA